MKHYLGEIKEHFGDMETSGKFLFSTDDCPHEYSDNVAMMWRDSSKEDWDEAAEGYWSDSALIFVGDIREVPEDDFRVLQKYIVTL